MVAVTNDNSRIAKAVITLDADIIAIAIFAINLLLSSSDLFGSLLRCFISNIC